MRFIALKEKNNYSNVLLLSHFLHLFFTLNSIVFIDGNTRIFLAQGTLAMPLSYAKDIKLARIFCLLSDIFTQIGLQVPTVYRKKRSHSHIKSNLSLYSLNSLSGVTSEWCPSLRQSPHINVATVASCWQRVGD